MSDGAPGVQQQLGAAGAPAVVRWRGKSYKVGHPTQAAKARLEELAADTAIQRVEAMAGKVRPPTYRILLDRVCDRVAAGEYRTWRAGWQEIVWTDGGSLFLLSLLHEFHPDLTVDDALAIMQEIPAQYRAAMARVCPDFFEILLAGLEVAPEQMVRVRMAINEFLTRLNPPPLPPSPTDETDSN